MDQKLADLLARKRKQSRAGDSIDWDDRRTGYLRAVNDLYSQIEEILAEATSSVSAAGWQG